MQHPVFCISDFKKLKSNEVENITLGFYYDDQSRDEDEYLTIIEQ